MLQVWVDGRLVDADRAVVSVYDRGFRAGEGVFETFRVYGEHVFRLDAHLARAFRGAGDLGFDVGATGAIRDACVRTATVNAAELGDRSVLRLTITPGAIDPTSPFPGRTVVGPTVVVTSHPLELPEHLYDDGVRAVTVPWGRELPQVKAVSYLASTMARRHAFSRGADEALFTDPGRRHVLEGSASNLFAVVGGALVTPPAEAILVGVTRQVVLEAAVEAAIHVDERPLTVAELTAADEAFLTATTREVVPLVAVDERPIGSGRPGPVTGRLHAAYRAAVEAEMAALGG